MLGHSKQPTVVEFEKEISLFLLLELYIQGLQFQETITIMLTVTITIHTMVITIHIIVTIMEVVVEGIINKIEKELQIGKFGGSHMKSY